MSTIINERAMTILGAPAAEWESLANDLSESGRDAMGREFEGLAERAASLAAYLDARAGGGCGDQGHAAAVKRANRAGRVVWCKAFGYNDHIGLTI